MTKLSQYYLDKAVYGLYHHLVQEGKERLITWFGKAMFHDMHVGGGLQVTTTPREMLEHLAATYGTAQDHRECMKQVETAFAKPFNPKLPVETYFMDLEEAMEDAEALGRAYTTAQAMDKALGHFDQHYGKDAHKAEDKWDDKADTDKTWTNFKLHWKKSIHTLQTRNRAAKHANQAIDKQVQGLQARIDSMQLDMSAMQVEHHSVQEENEALNIRHAFLNNALKAEQYNRQHSSSSDDVSALTEALTRCSSLEQRLAAKLENLGSTMNNERKEQNGGNGAPGPNSQELVHALQHKPPNTYAHMNGGKGLQFRKYCWNERCGCNTTHWTRACPLLSNELIERYKKANFRNTMGGSTKHLDRKGKWQADFNFDSW